MVQSDHGSAMEYASQKTEPKINTPKKGEFMKAFAQILITGVLIGQGAFAQDLNAVKSQILTLAQSYVGQADPDGSKAKSFEPLIEELLARSPQQSMADKAAAAVGAWKQVWGPSSYNNSGLAPSGLDPANIYQVVSSSGYYTNVGVYDFLGIHVVGLLKGEYQVNPDQIDVQFVQSGILLERVPEGYTLADLPALKDQGKLCLIEFPDFFPPVGIKGALVEVYDDQNLRITYGEQQGQSGKNLYIMQKVQALPY